MTGAGVCHLDPLVHEAVLMAAPQSGARYVDGVPVDVFLCYLSTSYEFLQLTGYGTVGGGAKGRGGRGGGEGLQHKTVVQSRVMVV
jgi:hypothetical protein